jgi:hypothetical protein
MAQAVRKFDFWFFNLKLVSDNSLKMKIVVRILSLLLVSALMINCDSSGNGSKSAEETQLEKLVGNWSLGSVTLDGSPRTDFGGVVMTIAGTFNSTGGTYSYSFTGTLPSPSPWPKNGTWQFGADPASQIVRLQDNQPINYSVNGNELMMTFTYSGGGFAGGRTEVVAGTWTFNFTKQ